MLSFLLLLLLLVPGANDQDGHNHHDHSSMETGESNNDGAWGEWSTEDLAAIMCLPGTLPLPLPSHSVFLVLTGSAGAIWSCHAFKLRNPRRQVC